jgi:hypothetical protein
MNFTEIVLQYHEDEKNQIENIRQHNNSIIEIISFLQKTCNQLDLNSFNFEYIGRTGFIFHTSKMKLVFNFENQWTKSVVIFCNENFERKFDLNHDFKLVIVKIFYHYLDFEEFRKNLLQKLYTEFFLITKKEYLQEILTQKAQEDLGII